MHSILLRAGAAAALTALAFTPAFATTSSGFMTPAFGPGSSASTPVGDAFLAAINSAKKTLDVTSFEITNPAAVNGIIAAAGRGVKVRLITDSSYTANAPFAAQLRGTHGVTVVERAGSNSTGIMHDKYTVIDGKAVWFGSANLSGGGMRSNAENGIEIKSAQLAADFEADFVQMWGAKWGNVKKTPPAHPTVKVPDGHGGQTSVDVFFSGQQGAAEFPALVAMVSSAKTSIHIMAYEFSTNNATRPLIDAIAAAAKRGVKVKALFDNSSSIETQANAGALGSISAAGGKTAQWHPNWGLMHNKVIIVDGATIEFGSFNLTELAAGLTGTAGNDDHFLIVHSNATLGAQYEATFAHLWAVAGGAP